MDEIFYGKYYIGDKKNSMQMAGYEVVQKHETAT